MVYWWFSVAAFDTHAEWHFALNAALHLLVSACLGRLVFKLSGNVLISGFAATAFALHPGMLIVGLWSSMRFDVLATLFSVLALGSLAQQPETRSNWLGVVVFASLAAFSKEISFVLLPAIAAHVLLTDSLTWKARIGRLATLALPFGMAVAARIWFLSSVDTQLNLANPFSGILRGALGWLENLPDALLGQPSTGWISSLAAAVLLGALVALFAFARIRIVDRRWAVTALLVFVSPMVLQAPVFQLVLVLDEPLSTPSNFRFYYLAGIGVVLILSLLFSAINLSTALRRAAKAATLVVLGLLTVRAHSATNAWTTGTLGEAQRVVEAASSIALTTKLEAPCTVFMLDVPEYVLEFPHYSDAAIKSQLPTTHPALGCIFVSERSPSRNFTMGATCDDSAWKPFATRTKGLSPVPAKRFGKLCIHHFADLPAEKQIETPRPYVFHWQQGKFIRTANAPE